VLASLLLAATINIGHQMVTITGGFWLHFNSATEAEFKSEEVLIHLNKFVLLYWLRKTNWVELGPS
jgi:hypothetical protein